MHNTWKIITIAPPIAQELRGRFVHRHKGRLVHHVKR